MGGGEAMSSHCTNPCGIPIRATPRMSPMDPRQKKLEERLTFLQWHVEQQDRVILDLSRELTRLSNRVARTEAKISESSDGANSGPPANERPPHW